MLELEDAKEAEIRARNALTALITAEAKPKTAHMAAMDALSDAQQ